MNIDGPDVNTDSLTVSIALTSSQVYFTRFHWTPQTDVRINIDRLHIVWKHQNSNKHVY